MKHMDIAKIMMMTHKWLRISNQHSLNISVLSWLRAVNEWSKWHFPELKGSNSAIVSWHQVYYCCCSVSTSLWPHGLQYAWLKHRLEHRLKHRLRGHPTTWGEQSQLEGLQLSAAFTGQLIPRCKHRRSRGWFSPRGPGSSCQESREPNWPKALRSPAFLLFSDKVNLTTASRGISHTVISNGHLMT